MKPNVLWIFVDEHRGDAMGCAGDPNIETPHLDRLEAEGVRFSRAYSNTPICTPARGTVYTGQYITSHGARANHYPLLPDRGPQMAEVMSAAGYRTCHHGKWHLSGGTVNQHFVSPFFRPGWDEWIGWECMHGLADNGTYYDTTYGKGDIKIRAEKIDGFQTDWLTDRSVEFVERQSSDQPWFHALSIETPHPPCDAPDNVSEPHYRLFMDKKIELKPNVPASHREEAVEFLRGYYSHIKNIDENVGRILETLEKTGQLENTLIVFFADHGDFAGSHGRACGKSSPLEESAGIPFIVRLPSCLQARRRSDSTGHVSHAFMSLVDLMPTTLGLCGLTVPETCQGQDLSPLVRGDIETGPEDVYLQFESSYFARREPHRFWRAIRWDDWMYSVNQAHGPEYLYNLAEDPHEMVNLVNDPAHEALRHTLHERMVAKANEIQDDFFVRAEKQVAVASCS